MDAMTSSQRKFLEIIDPFALIQEDQEPEEEDLEDEIQRIIADATERGDKKLLKLATHAHEYPHLRANLWSYLYDNGKI